MAGSHPGQRTSLIVTVLNEAGTLGELLTSIAAQTRPPDEIVVVDGGSRDATWEILQAWSTCLPLRCLRVDGASISRGRNLAVAAARSELIAVTDAGVRLEPDWLEQLVSHLHTRVDVVGGFFKPEPRNPTPFERAMGATVLPTVEDIDPATFQPSSRSVLFRRSAWQAAGGYPEWLDYCEDVVFDLALRRAGQRFAFAPEAIAWFRPRGSLRTFFRQYFLYARGDGKADLWPGRHLIRYLTYSVAAGLLRQGGRAVLLLALGGWLYTRRPYARLRPQLARLGAAETVYVLGLVPTIRLVGDVAKMVGYPVGRAWRLRRFRRAWTYRSSF